MLARFILSANSIKLLGDTKIIPTSSLRELDLLLREPIHSTLRTGHNLHISLEALDLQLEFVLVSP